jgi:hypothetical protein
MKRCTFEQHQRPHVVRVPPRRLQRDLTAVAAPDDDRRRRAERVEHPHGVVGCSSMVVLR